MEKKVNDNTIEITLTISKAKDPMVAYAEAKAAYRKEAYEKAVLDAKTEKARRKLREMSGVYMKPHGSSGFEKLGPISAFTFARVDVQKPKETSAQRGSRRKASRDRLKARIAELEAQVKSQAEAIRNPPPT